MTPELQGKIDDFLLVQRRSEGGYALVTDQDHADLNDIIKDLIRAKCERDPDGDLPFEFSVINRREKHFAIDPWINGLPYRDEDELNPLKRGGRLEKLMFIVKQSTSMLSTELDVVQYINSEREEATAKWIDKVTN